MIFVDTSAFYAMHVGTCEEHRTAVEIRDKIASGQFESMITTNLRLFCVFVSVMKQQAKLERQSGLLLASR